MTESWADWNRGIDDAYAYLQPKAGMPRQYYDGYYFACALDFEGITAQRSCAIAEFEGAQLVSSSSARESEISVQLQRLAARFSTGTGPSAIIPGAGPAQPVRSSRPTRG